jgi:glycosyltransferase involved in cell wall biosynthesis
MRILMVMTFRPSGPIGGSERQARKLIKALMDQDLDVEIVTGWWSRKEPRTEMFDRVPIRWVFTFWNMGGIKGLRKFGTYAYMLTLLGYLVRHRGTYDIIHIHSMSPSAFVGVLAAKLLGKKTVIKVMASGEWSDLKRMRDNSFVLGTRYMLPVIRRYCDCIVALNQETAKELQEADFASERIVLIPNGVVVGGGQRRIYRLHTPVRLVFVGRLQRQKGLDVLLQALVRLKKIRPAADWRLRVFGDGPRRAEYESLADDLGIADQVQFEGQVPDVPAQLMTADIFVLPSRAEGMSNALLEAMAAGLPCIAARIGGNTDLIEDSINGLLVPPEDPEALARAIVSLLDSQSLREELAHAAQSLICQRYTIDSVADRYVNLYTNLLALPEDAKVAPRNSLEQRPCPRRHGRVPTE